MKIEEISKISILSIPISLNFQFPIKRDVDSLRGVIRGLARKHGRELRWLYENPRKNTKYYRFVGHKIITSKILRFKFRFLHPKFVKLRDILLESLDSFGKDGILNGEEKVKFDVKVGEEKKERYEKIKLDKEGKVELKFKTPIIYDVDPWSILRGVGSKIYQLYEIEIPKMEGIREKAKEWKFERNLSRYIFRRKGNEYWGWRGSIRFEVSALSESEKEITGWLLGVGRITGIGKFSMIGFGDYDVYILPKN